MAAEEERSSQIVKREAEIMAHLLLEVVALQMITGGVLHLHWRRKWQPTPVLLPGESHGWRSMVAYSPWGRKRVGHD